MSERPATDRNRATTIALARAFFMTRLHLLRLTEVVRLQIRPNDEGVMLLPEDLDEEVKKQAFDFVLATFPEEYHLEIVQARAQWLNVQ
jgi:hypothetical protein